MTRTLYNLVAITCFFASGFLALAYEICWIRKASLVFGAATFALSSVLAVFFAGLAFGSYAFGKYSPRTSRPLRLYALLEISVGVIVLLSPVAFSLADLIYGRFYPLVLDSFTLLSFTRCVLVAVLLLLPATLMGGTMPLFCRQYVRNEKRISLSVGLLYGLNTLGAAGGCATCGFFLIRHLGVNATLYAGGVLNILIGTIVWLLPVPAPPLPRGSAPHTSPVGADVASMPPEAPRRQTILYCLFFLSGFVALGNEILWARYLSLLMHNTVHTYTLTLTVILVGIVLGSVLTAGFFDRSRRRPLVFGAVQIATGLTVLAALMMPAAVWRQWLDPQHVGAQLWNVILVLLVPAIFSGASFPLAVRMVVDQPAKSGIGVGRMAALNTMGGIAGSLAIGFFVLPGLGLQVTVLLTSGASLTIGFAAWLLLERTLAPLARYGLIVLATSLWLAIPFLTGTRLPADFLADRGKLVDFREGLRSQMAVVRKGHNIQLEIDRLWQGENRKTHQIMAAHVPMLLHPDPKNVLVIGIGPGQTASRLLMYPLEKLDCVEIESGLMPFVKQHFESAWMDDERVHFIIEDGRNYLTHTNAKYDLISIEVGQVFRPGTASFYTADFYTRARRRLKPNGLLCQFVPIFYFDPDEFRTVIGTFLDSFPTSALWYNKSELLLVGTTADTLKLRADRLALLNTHDAVRRDMAYAYWGGPAHHLNRPEVFLAGFLAGPAGLAKLVATTPIYRDDLPYLEYTTSLHGKKAEMAIVKLIQAHLEPIQGSLDIPLDQQMQPLIESIRQQNLRDIVALFYESSASFLQARGRHRDAIKRFHQALQWNASNVTVILNLGAALGSQGRRDEAIHRFRQVLAIKPDHLDAHYNLANALRAGGKLREAIGHYRQALAIKGDYAEAHHELARALRAGGNLDEAIDHYRRALAIKDDDGEVHNDLGWALRRSGQPHEALKHFRKAMRLLPDSPTPLGNMAWILATYPDAPFHEPNQAIRLAERASALSNHQSAWILDTLAAAYAAAGQHEQAVKTAQAALALATAPADPLAGQIRGRLELYKREKPYREPVRAKN